MKKSTGVAFLMCALSALFLTGCGKTEHAPDRQTNIAFQVAGSNAKYQAGADTKESDALAKDHSGIPGVPLAGSGTILFRIRAFIRHIQQERRKKI